MQISFLTSGHSPYDDRIFYHLAKTLSENGYKVEIVSSKSSLKEIHEGISINCFPDNELAKKAKIENFERYLISFDPDIVICSEPLPVLAAKRYKKNKPGKVSIIYDITEWYPSKKNLADLKGLSGWFTFLKLLLFNIYSSSISDAFIFGEWYKSKPYRMLFPSKPFSFVTYYPDLRYIPQKKSSHLAEALVFSYSGKISIEKGFENFFRVINTLAKENQELKISIKIIGWYESDKDKAECESFINQEYTNISLSFSGRQDFQEFIEEISDTYIFLDLRNDDYENQRCLPIRLFYYLALGKPVIFSDLKAIRHEVETDESISLIKPGDINNVVKIITQYLQDPDLYARHCINARNLAEKKYNWHRISPDLLQFISSFLSD